MFIIVNITCIFIFSSFIVLILERKLGFM